MAAKVRYRRPHPKLSDTLRIIYSRRHAPNSEFPSPPGSSTTSRSAESIGSRSEAPWSRRLGLSFTSSSHGRSESSRMTSRPKHSNERGRRLLELGA